MWCVLVSPPPPQKKKESLFFAFSKLSNTEKKVTANSFFSFLSWCFHACGGYNLLLLTSSKIIFQATTYKMRGKNKYISHIHQHKESMEDYVWLAGNYSVKQDSRFKIQHSIVQSNISISFSISTVYQPLQVLPFISCHTLYSSLILLTIRNMQNLIKMSSDFRKSFATTYQDESSFKFLSFDK